MILRAQCDISCWNKESRLGEGDATRGVVRTFLPLNLGGFADGGAQQDRSLGTKAPTQALRAL
jgi:hypothetical protein